MLRSLLGAALLLLLPFQLRAQDDGFTWENQAELSHALASGNASTTAFAIGAELKGEGGPNQIAVELGGLRVSSDITTRTATGTTTSFTVVEDTRTELTAASYKARGRYDRSFDGAFGFLGTGWERNTFSGISHRFSAVMGLGRTWVDGDTGHLKTDVGGTYTVERPVERIPGANEDFAGVRVTIDAMRSLTSTTDLSSKLLADNNVEDGGDFRADWVSSLAVSISEGFALKTSLQLLYDHEPAFIRVPIVNSGTPTGETVLVSGDEIDTVWTVALVIKL